MLPIKKIYIDSRQKTADSASHSDFSVDLPTTYLMPDDTGFYVEDICLPVAWWTIEYLKNDVFIFQFNGSTKSGVIPPGTYTTQEFAAILQKTMYLAIGYDTTWTAANPWSVQWYKPTNSISISWAPGFDSTGKTFTVPTTYELKNIIGGIASIRNRNCNELLKNFTSYQTYTATKPFYSGYIDMNPIRNLYLTCTGLGNFSTVSLSGDRSIIKKSP